MQQNKTLIIAADSHHARCIIRQLDRHNKNKDDINGHPRFYVTYPGEALMGMRFEAIIVTDAFLQVYYVDETERTRQWYEQAKLRVVPDGLHLEL